ncbi:MAG: GGDEF domain-containing protein [Gammaproteobacteria bacterium]|uniref:GGDEF domain-containing protein n=1 Tax=Candidatus Thiopontia autotrophica TaxID=2841688 RepID=A0A8J6TXQ3_9GAMM|nr:GGDEF domain-containing protein [Candidatus Thiopontia autotrophica]
MKARGKSSKIITSIVGDGAETLLKSADLAMYRSKKRGHNGYAFYTEEID